MDFFLGLISAKRFFRHIVAFFGKGPGSTSSTYLYVFTTAAPAFIERKISKFHKYIRGLPYFPQALFSQAPAIYFQVPARLYIAPMRYKAEANAPQTTPSHGIQTMGLGRNLFPFRLCSLPQYAVIMGCTSGF